jgi:ribonucleotide reductase alpha subunit
MYISSISKIVVPTITKHVIFINQIFKKLNEKGIFDINKYLENNVDQLIKLYNKSFKYETIHIDEKLLNNIHRQLLLNCNKFILYIYLKPDEETRIEIIFENYEDFKHWINGIEELMTNKEIMDIMKKRYI